MHFSAIVPAQRIAAARVVRGALAAMGMAVIIGWPQPLPGQDTVPPAATGADTLRALRPGDAAFDSRFLRSDTTRYTLTVFRDGSQLPVGQLTDELQRDSLGQRVLLRRVQTVRRGSSQLIDSTVTDAHSLAPRLHRSLQPTRRISLDFHGRRVRGSVGPVDAPPVPLDTTLPLPAFDSGNWDLLVRALPLAKDYAARFIVFDLDAGLRAYHIRVTGSAVVQDEEAHVVVFTIARGRESVVWIGKESGQILRIETLLGPTTMLQQERVRETSGTDDDGDHDDE